VLTRDEISEETVATERRIADETARNEGKPEAALAKIVEGRVNGFFKENVLLEQDFAKDNKLSVQKVLDQSGTKVSAFVRFRVGA
jgi:elongation factor Ts